MLCMNNILRGVVAGWLVVGTMAGGAELPPLPDWGEGAFAVVVRVRCEADGTLVAMAPVEGKWHRQGKSLFLRGGRVCYDIGWVGALRSQARVDDGAWHHVVLSVPGPNRQQLYIDGQLDTEGELKAEPDPANSIFRVGFTAPNFPDRSYGRGELDHLALFNRALSAREVSRLAAGSGDPVPAPLAEWTFDGGWEDRVNRRELQVSGGASRRQHDQGTALILDGTGWLQYQDPARLRQAEQARQLAKRLSQQGGRSVPDALAVIDALEKAGSLPSTQAVRARDTFDKLRTPGEDFAAWTDRFDRAARDVLMACGEALLPPSLLFVQRYKYTSNHYYTDYINSAYMPGGGLCVLDLASGEARPLAPDLSKGVTGRYDLSFDGREVVLAWKSGADEGYRLYRCGVDGRNLVPITRPPENEAELIATYRVRYHHGTDDMDPCFLPDGGVAFISTRCQYGTLCDAPDDFTTTLLYRTDRDGKQLEQLSNGALSEATPSVAGDGRLIYTRWEYVDKGAVSVKCIWAMRPDGTGSEELYGNTLALPPTLLQARVLPGEADRLVMLGTPHYPQNGVGTVLRVDLGASARTREPLTYITPDVDVRREGGYWWAKGRGERLFKDPYPLGKGFYLASMAVGGWEGYKDLQGWRLVLLDEQGHALCFYEDPALGSFQPMPLQARPRPPVPAAVHEPTLARQGLARCIVTDIYAGMEDVPRGDVKYLRINEQVPRPWAARRLWPGDVYDQQHACITKATHLGLKVQHGVVPVEADGSAHFLVPADRNIFFQALDENYMEVQRERTFVNYRAGEVRSCIGCHEPASRSPHPSAPGGVPVAMQRAPSTPGPQPGEQAGTRPLYYPADVQPILDRHCHECHQGPELKGGLDLSGTPTDLFSVSYEQLLSRQGQQPSRSTAQLAGPIIGENHPKTGNVHYLPPRSLGSHASMLAAMLFPDRVTLSDPKRAERAAELANVHREVHLNQAEQVRLTTWLDSNGQFYGAWWGRRNLRYRDHPNFRPVPTFVTAVSPEAPLPETER